MSESDWTTVQTRKTKRSKKQQADHHEEYDNAVKPDCQDWDPVIFHKRPVYSKKGAIAPGTPYVTVSTGKTGQPRDYDPRKHGKLDDATDSSRIKRVGREMGLKIQQARQSQALSQKDLAFKMSVPLSVVSQWESGSAVHEGSVLQKFRKFINF